MEGGELEIIKMEKYNGMKALSEGSLKPEVVGAFWQTWWWLKQMVGDEKIWCYFMLNLKWTGWLCRCCCWECETLDQHKVDHVEKFKSNLCRTLNGSATKPLARWCLLRFFSFVWSMFGAVATLSFVSLIISVVVIIGMMENRWRPTCNWGNGYLKKTNQNVCSGFWDITPCYPNQVLNAIVHLVEFSMTQFVGIFFFIKLRSLLSHLSPPVQRSRELLSCSTSAQQTCSNLIGWLCRPTFRKIGQGHCFDGLVIG